MPAPGLDPEIVAGLHVFNAGFPTGKGQHGRDELVGAAGGGWLALRFGGDVSDIFLALAVALGVFAIVNAAAIAGGA